MDCRALCDADAACASYSAGGAAEGGLASSCFLAGTAAVHTRCPSSLGQAARLEGVGGWHVARDAGGSALVLAHDAGEGGLSRQELRAVPRPECALAIGACDAGSDAECRCDGSDGDTCAYMAVEGERVVLVDDPSLATWWVPTPDADDPARVSLRMGGACRFLTASGAELTADPDGGRGAGAASCAVPAGRASWRLAYGTAGT